MAAVRNGVVAFVRSKRLRNALATNVLSSLGNLSLSIAIAHQADIDGLGRFAIAFSIYILATGVNRASVTEPLTAVLPEVGDLRSGSRRVSLLGFAFALIFLATGLILGNGFVMLTSVTIHGALIFDYIKNVNMAIGNSRIAAIQELAWATTTLVGVWLVFAASLDPLVCYGVWAVANACLGYLFSFFLKYSLKPRWKSSFVGSRVSASFGVDFLMGTGAAQLTVMLLAPVVGLAAVGAIRGGGTIFGPLTLVINTARSLLIPYLTRRRAASGTSLAHAYQSALCLAIVALPIAAGASLIPDSIGRLILGDNWHFADPLIPFLAIEFFFTVMSAVPFAGHRSLHAASRTIKVRAVMAPMRMIIVLGFGHFFGVQGAVGGMALISVAGATAWWWSYRSLLIGRGTHK